MPGKWYHKTMKELQKEFVMNADKCGNHTFTQVRREKNVALYRRDKVDTGRFQSCEVFFVKVVKAGSPLPGGGTVAEDYEQYPGASAFGRTAWSICGKESDALLCANKRFEELLKETSEVETTTDETVIPVIKVSNTERRALNWPDKPFTQKELAAFNHIDNYKEVYTDLQRALASGKIVVSGQRESTRGKSAKLFSVVVKSVQLSGVMVPGDSGGLQND